MSGIKDELPYELTNLDDAFTIAINSIYLLTEEEPPYPKGMRVALEVLGGGDLHQEAPLIELSEMLMRLADRREMGHRAEDMLVAGREWLMSKNLGEEQACVAAADTIRGIRNVLDKEFVLHQPFRNLDFVSVKPDFARAG